MNFFDMLVLSRKLSFTDGRVSLYGNDISIYPASSLMDYILSIDNDSESVKSVYSTAKQSILEEKVSLVKYYDKSKGNSWITDTINLHGLGMVKFVGPGTMPYGEIILENSPFAKNLKGKIDRPADDVLRGLIAGFITAVLNLDYDVIETDCEAISDNKCRFILDTRENLAVKLPLLYKNQIP